MNEKKLFREMEIRIHYEICHKHSYVHNFSNSDLHIVNIHFRVAREKLYISHIGLPNRILCHKNMDSNKKHL